MGTGRNDQQLSQPLLGRRQFLLAAGALITAAAGGLEGCGGGSSGAHSAFQTTRASGVVVLPSGLSIPLSSLTVGAVNASTVDAGGAFQFDQVVGRDSMVVVADSTGKPLLAAFTDQARSPMQVNATSTAIALLFYGTGSFTLPPTHHARMRQLIAASPSVAILATALGQRLAANSNALGGLDPQLQTAIQAALDSLRQGRSAPQSTLMRTTISTASSRGLPTSRATRDNPAFTLILAQPSTPQSGVIVGSSDDGTGLQITNTKRRNLLRYITQTGYDDAAGKHQEVSIPVRTGAFPGDWIEATHKLAGVIGSVVDEINGTGAYEQVKSDIIPLPVNPATARRSYYRVTIAGPGLDPGYSPKEGPAVVQSGASGMLALGFVKDIFLPLLFSVLDIPLTTEELLNQPALLASSKGVISIFTGAVHVGIGLTHFDPGTIAVSVLKLMTDDYTFRQAILNWFTDTLFNQGLNPSKLLTANQILTRLNFLVSVLEKAMALGDASVTALDWGQSNYFDEWAVTVVKPTVRINPDGATVTNLNSLSLTAVTPVTGNLTYHWTTDATLGSLTDVKSNPGNGTNDITTTSASISYVGTKMPLAGSGITENIFVEVFLIKDSTSARISVGKASAKIVRTRLPQQMFSATPSVLDLDDTGFGTQHDVGLYMGFPIVPNAKLYTLTVHDDRYPEDRKTTILPSDIGPPAPAGVHLQDPHVTAIPHTWVVQPDLPHGGNGLDYQAFRSGDTIQCVVFGVTWRDDGIGASFKGRDAAVAALLALTTTEHLKIDVVVDL